VNTRPDSGAQMTETDVQSFWNAHPCGDHIVGGLHAQFADDYDSFFTAYDNWRYRQEGHIPLCLDRIDWRNRKVLEIGLGQGAESEQLIRRGAHWSGLDLTRESVERVTARLAVRKLEYDEIRQGSALAIPWPDNSFDLVFSHGVLHHIPDILSAQGEIHRVLKPGGTLVAMLYARASLNYQVSIRFVRRAVLAAAFPLRRTKLVRSAPMLRQHIDNAEELGLRRYLAMDTFTHKNTDGPLNPYARVYSLREVARDFPDFEVVDSYRRYLHAPPLPVHRLPGERWLGWHLWVHLRARPRRSSAAAPRADARNEPWM
jgi:SAM-dependent methyltransferase